MSAVRHTTMAHAMGADPEQDQKAVTAQRQKALRTRRLMTIEELHTLTGISEGNLRNYENETRGVPVTPAKRAVLARAFGLDSAQYDAYLAGDLSVEEAVQAGGEPQPASAARVPKGPILRNHPQWAEFCAQAMEMDRGSTKEDQITAEDLRALGMKPFVLAPLHDVTARDVLDLARMVHRHRT